MFDRLRELVGQLDNETDFTKYKNCSGTRKLLQEIKKEAQEKRNAINELRKK